MNDVGRETFAGGVLGQLWAAVAKGLQVGPDDLLVLEVFGILSGGGGEDVG